MEADGAQLTTDKLALHLGRPHAGRLLNRAAASGPLRTAHATLTQTLVIYRYVRGCCCQSSVYANFVDVSLTYSSSQSRGYYRLNTHRNTQS